MDNYSVIVDHAVLYHTIIVIIIMHAKFHIYTVTKMTLHISPLTRRYG